MTNEEAEKLLAETAAKLGEHFDAVQILASWCGEGDGGTRCAKRGVGNWYARQGMCHEFIQTNIAEDTAAAIANKLEPPDDGWAKSDP